MGGSIHEINIFRPIRAHFQRKLQQLRQELLENITSECMDTVLESALEAMRILFIISPEYRRNIRNFRGKIGFKTEDGKLGATAIFKRGWFFRDVLEVNKEAEDDTNITIIFKNGRAMAEFLMAPNPDIISGMLDNKLDFIGNLNYILRFIYLARRIPYLLNLQHRS